METIDQFIEQKTRELSEEVDRILLGKLKKIVQSIENEIEGNVFSEYDHLTNTKLQLLVILKEAIEPDESKRYLGGQNIHKELEQIGYRLEVERPAVLEDLAQKIQEENGSYSFRFFITERDYKVKLYKLEYEA